MDEAIQVEWEVKFHNALSSESYWHILLMIKQTPKGLNLGTDLGA